MSASIRTIQRAFSGSSSASEQVSPAQEILSSMTKHYVIAAKKPGYTPEFKPYIDEWARVLLVLQSTPEIASEEYRSKVPVTTKNYMGEAVHSFSSQEMYLECKRVHDRVMAECPKANDFILRSNDGVTAENSWEQALVA